ncbi:phage tail fiber protein [Klebsiella variicola]|uniref:phage tail fiber domain-containing protein n=3 Tax=Klebsiella pneumoniae complex TaxID=3390273 RepID=UPI00240371F8|nr:phage tail fiber protein [Klebsiella variicola]MDI0464358.1 phage tail fiber protein [Klebsiella variicola]
MTVSTQVSRNEYTGNGATTQYDFTFRILDKSHLLVQTLDTSESIVTLTLGTDYTVTGVNRYNGGKVVLTSALPAGYKISIARSTPVTQEASIRNQGGFFPEIHEDAFDKLTMLVQQAYGWWSGLSLRKPSWLANYYDALNNRIRNLRDPSQAQDAATKNYVDVQIVDNTNAWKAGDAVLDQKIDANFRRTIRVPEPSVGMLPSILARKNKLIACDSNGDPIAVLPESGSASEVLIELASNEIPGSSLIGLKYHGTVADALVDIYVDALGDFKNKQDGCTEAILAAVAHWGGRTDSAYVQGQKKYGRIHFPNGTYALEDLPFIAGWDYELEPFTLIVPHRNAKFAFTTVGTKGVVPGDPTWQRLMYSQISGGVIGDYWKETGNVPVGAGGINLLNGSYVRLRNIAIRHIRGIAIYGGELFDSPFENVSVMYCGNADPNNYAPCVLFDNAGGHDATNACKFDRLHLEANHTGGIWNKCRHMIFNSMKVERDEGTHVLAGCLGMTFMAPGLTFNRNDIPQFLIKDFAKDDTTEQAASDSRGVIFESPSCISSSAGNGWYFYHTSNAAPMEISNLFGNGTGLIFKGKNATIHGGTTYDCGPVLVDAEKDVAVYLVKWRAIKKTAVGDGTDDAIILRGANCKVVSCDFTGQPVDSASLAIPNGAFINTAATADSVVTDNTVGGYRQYGIRASLNQKVRDNKINLDNNHIGSLTNQSRSNSTLVIDNTTGFGLGTVNQSAPVLAAGATQELTIVGGCTDLHIRVISGTTAAAAKVLADSSIAGLGVYSQLNTALLSFSAGAPGDGMVHITKPLSGASITVANYTASNVTVVITRTNVMPA